MPHFPGGRHELGQNFLHHRPTIARIVDLASTTSGEILEIGAGDGALTRELARLGRRLTAIDIDERRVRRLRRVAPDAHIVRADAMSYPWEAPVIVGNIPFHLTTPVLRRLLREDGWRHAVLLTQWEVARKRAGVGGSTMMTAQAAPWFEFALVGRVPARHFTPMPSVDGGLLAINRRSEPLIDPRYRRGYEQFVRATFTGRGRSLDHIVAGAAQVDRRRVQRAMRAARIPSGALPRDLSAPQWAALWHQLH